MRRYLSYLTLCLGVITAACTGIKEPPSCVVSIGSQEETGFPDDAAPKIVTLVFIILAAGLLASCTLFRPTGSWVDEIGEKDAPHLAGVITSMIADRLPPGEKPIYLVPTAAESMGAPLAAELKIALQDRGYSIVQGTGEPDNADELRYWITANGKGLLLRMQIAGDELSTVLIRDETGALHAAAPLTVREASDE